MDYFQVTHRIKEEVSQPAILQGGTLKEYQVGAHCSCFVLEI